MFVFYTIVLTLGFVTSYTDIRFRKIKNIHLLLAIFLGIIAYFDMIVTQQRMFNINLVLNLFIGLGIGMLLYFTDTWGAGDAKLFAVFCLIMPAEKYPKVLFFPSIAIFVNIFLVSTVGVLILSMNDIIKDRIRILKAIFSVSTLTQLGGSFLIIFSLKWVIEIAVNFFIPQAKPIISILVLFFSYRIIRWMFKKFKNKYIVSFIICAGLISRFLVFSLDFNIGIFFLYLKITSFYTLLFQTIFSIFELNKSDDKKVKAIPFAPLMFIGTVLVNTNLINWVMNMLRSMQKW